MRGVKQLSLSSFAIITLSWGFGTPVQRIPEAIAQTQVPMRLQHAEGTYTLTVSETNTTKSAYGGQLRLYDVHIAKMFEVTYSDCQEIPNAGGRTWYYRAGNGKIDMGQFRINCQLASDIANTYGLGKPERTAIEYSQGEAGRPISRTRSIPILDITGNKIQRWTNFVQGFRPQSANSEGGNSRSSISFPVREILSQIEGKTRVPIFLPSQLPFSQKIYLKNRVETNGYSVEMGHIPNCSSTPCYIGSISAERGGEPAQAPPRGFRSEFKTLKLAGRTQGVFSNGCGAYCTALVEWQYQGVLYRVTMKNGREETLVQIANSAIEAGPR
jgi:serine/threonine-protein kinase